jgi:hypothetical protein
LVKEYERGDMERVEWLDVAVFREIERVQAVSCAVLGDSIVLMWGAGNSGVRRQTEGGIWGDQETEAVGDSVTSVGSSDFQAQDGINTTMSTDVGKWGKIRAVKALLVQIPLILG